MYSDTTLPPFGSTGPNSYERYSTQYQTPPQSPHSSDNSDADSQFSEESAASSQTSYSSQDPWTVQVQPDSQAPVGKTPCKSFQDVQLQHHQNPRRTTTREAPIPSLVKVVEKKGQFVYHLVDSATHLVEIVWPTSAPVSHMGSSPCTQSMLPLRTFIEETLRRSKTSFSTLQVALYYLVQLKEHVPSVNFMMEQPDDSPVTRALQCGRRMFLAALILASKYLQDRNYTARAWSKISGLQVPEINLNERAFLAAVKWKLHIPEPVFNRWQDILIKYSQPQMVNTWRAVIRELTPDMICAPATPVAPWVAPSFKTPDWRSRTQSPVSPIEGYPWQSSVPSPASSSPRTVEPRFVMQPPAAPMALKLPTPSPLSSACSTPAASSACDMLRYANRPRAMCSAMSMVSSRFCNDMAPSAMGYNGAPGQFSRRSSLANSASCASSASPSSASSPTSPGSMISDHGSSRSSSIASLTCPQNTSPRRNCALSRLATVNAAHKLVDYSAAAAAQSNTYDDVTILGSGPLTAGPYTSSPEAIIIEDDSTPLAYETLPMRESRKRHRSSVDSITTSDVLQDHVRSIMRQDLHASKGGESVRPRLSSGRPKPVAKRACFMAEVPGRDDFVRPEGGPGMWSGILPVES